MKRTYLILSLFAIFATQLPAIEEKPQVPTEIESEYLQMENNGEESYFIAQGSVILTATNLVLTCDKLEMWVKQLGEKDATIGNFGNFDKIIATGNVEIIQAERTAKAGLMEIDPKEEQVVLKDNPSVYQAGTTLSGLEIIIKRGEGIVIVPGSKSHKVRFVGPTIKDLGFESDKSIEEETTEDSVETEETDPAETTDQENSEELTTDSEESKTN